MCMCAERRARLGLPKKREKKMARCTRTNARVDAVGWTRAKAKEVSRTRSRVIFFIVRWYTVGQGLMWPIKDTILLIFHGVKGDKKNQRICLMNGAESYVSERVRFGSSTSSPLLSSFSLF